MSRIVIAALLCLLATACGASDSFFPSGQGARLHGEEFVPSGFAGLIAAVVTYFLMRDVARARGADRLADLALRAVLVLCVSFLGGLTIVFGFVDTSGPADRGVSWSVAVIAWGAMLLLYARVVRRPPRLAWLARIGGLLAVAAMPCFLFAIWVDGDQRIWKTAETLAIFAGMCAHATFVAGVPIPFRRRWLAVVTLAGSALWAAAASLALWGARGFLDGWSLRLLTPLTLTGTMLVILCRRRAADTDEIVGPPIEAVGIRIGSDGNGRDGDTGSERHSMIEVADDLLAALSVVPSLRSCDEARASARPAPGRWSRKEILGHLIDSAANNHQRLVRMQLQPHVEFPGYAQDAWVRVSKHQERPWLELVSVWEACNRQVAAVLRHVDPSTLRNTWTDPEGRRVDLEFVARDYVVHLRHHLEQLAVA